VDATYHTFTRGSNFHVSTFNSLIPSVIVSINYHVSLPYPLIYSNPNRSQLLILLYWWMDSFDCQNSTTFNLHCWSSQDGRSIFILGVKLVVIKFNPWSISFIDFPRRMVQIHRHNVAFRVKVWNRPLMNGQISRRSILMNGHDIPLEYYSMIFFDTFASKCWNRLWKMDSKTLESGSFSPSHHYRRL